MSNDQPRFPPSIVSKGDRPKVVIHPDQNILIGRKAIKNYLGIRSTYTLAKLINDHMLPVFKNVDHRLTTSCTLIDQWIELQSELFHERRRKERAERQKKKDPKWTS